MKIVISELGTHGDISTLILLGNGLTEKSHDVFFLTSSNYKEIVIENGMEFVEIASECDYIKYYSNPEVWDVEKAHFTFNNPMSRKAAIISYNYTSELIKRNHKVLVVTLTRHNGARLAAEEIGAPAVLVTLSPAAFDNAWDFIERIIHSNRLENSIKFVLYDNCTN